jgi:hypothetical protein
MTLVDGVGAWDELPTPRLYPTAIRRLTRTIWTSEPRAIVADPRKLILRR